MAEDMIWDRFRSRVLRSQGYFRNPSINKNDPEEQAEKILHQESNHVREYFDATVTPIRRLFPIYF